MKVSVCVAFTDGIFLALELVGCLLLHILLVLLSHHVSLDNEYT